MLHFKRVLVYADFKCVCHIPLVTVWNLSVIALEFSAAKENLTLIDGGSLSWLADFPIYSGEIALFFLFIPSAARAEQEDICARLYREAALDWQYGMSFLQLWFYQFSRLYGECQISAMTCFHYCWQLIYVSLVLQPLYAPHNLPSLTW